MSDTQTTTDDWLPNLRRGDASRYLRERYGINLAATTLAKMFSQRSDGPPAFVAGRWPLYPREGLDAWATKRLGRLRSSTSDES